ncbi:molybdopterin molybdotransferase MoeA [Flammeovirga agarivorans]|uniref:Molybdopterin molybdenumtransferase n=1 Tax=Flammeovirga agarivorans TaxID=2726742 RepID=A0A7X8XUS5_9BACT|nr:molybdopterin molybdotransferase MoeA [Flammeovirga agarivorans]NLR90677.1 molybdopterin molybdotransferase MoeA [Flammeovirga agarivorans]
MQNQLIEPSLVDEIISKVSLAIGTEKVNLQEALGKTLAEDIHADRDFPPFNRVAMDGIGIHDSMLNPNGNTFLVEGVQAAGAPQLTLKENTNCIEVMTGSMLPEGANVVIPYEWTEKQGDKITVSDFKHAEFMTNIHQQGVDQKKGDVILSKGQQITSAEIGVLATVGYDQVEVIAAPKIAVIATGDELVAVNEVPKDYQIRMSNCYSLQATLKDNGCQSDIYHLVDEYDLLKTKIENLSNEYDILVFSGGVSKGKFDYLPKVFDELGIVKQFHGVKQRPGKPFWFGITKDEKAVFALPGNPVSTFLCSNRYLLPWLTHQLKNNQDNLPTKAYLDVDYSFKKPLTYFLQVKTYFDETGRLMAQPVTGGGSGDLSNLTSANAFLELPADQDNFEKGQQLPIWFYKK